MMNLKEACEKALEKYQDDYYYIGIRFEDKDRKIGETCEYSRHNTDREDEREFPEFGTAEYDEMFVLDGTSAWNLETYDDFKGPFNTYHCYIIAGNRITNRDDGLDDNEIVIENAVVLEKLF